MAAIDAFRPVPPHQLRAHSSLVPPGWLPRLRDLGRFCFAAVEQGHPDGRYRRFDSSALVESSGMLKHMDPTVNTADVVDGYANSSASVMFTVVSREWLLRTHLSSTDRLLLKYCDRRQAGYIGSDGELVLM